MYDKDLDLDVEQWPDTAFILGKLKCKSGHCFKQFYHEESYYPACKQNGGLFNQYEVDCGLYPNTPFRQWQPSSVQLALHSSRTDVHIQCYYCQSLIQFIIHTNLHPDQKGC